MLEAEGWWVDGVLGLLGCWVVVVVVEKVQRLWVFVVGLRVGSVDLAANVATRGKVEVSHNGQ